jgi:hypothetical protein
MPKYGGLRFDPLTEEQNAAVRLYTDEFGRDMFNLKLSNRKTWYPVNAAEILSLSNAVEPVAREIRRRGKAPSLHR